MDWVKAEERLPRLRMDNNGNADFVLVRYKESPECGSEFQTANVFWVNAHSDQITHWAKIDSPLD